MVTNSKSYNNAYYQANKEHLTRKIYCDSCNLQIGAPKFARHCRTARHMKNIQLSSYETYMNIVNQVASYETYLKTIDELRSSNNKNNMPLHNRYNLPQTDNNNDSDDKHTTP